MLLKVTNAKNVWFANINNWFKFQNVVCSGCHDWVVIQAVLLLSMSKVLIIIVLFIKLILFITLTINLLKSSVLQNCGYIYKINIVLSFSLLNTTFLNFFLSIYKTVDSMEIYKSVNIDIGTVIKNPKMLKLVPDC